MKKYILYLNTLIITLFLSACGNSKSEFPSTTSLNSDQQDAIAQLLIVASVFPTENYLPIGLQEPVDETIDCDVSGTFSAKGNVDFEEDEQNQEFNGTFTLNEVVFTDCVTTTANDEEITINGSLEVVTDLVLDNFNDGEDGILTGSFDSTYEGSLEVSGDELEDGTCGINMEGKSLLAEFFIVGELSGNLCGSNYDKVVPLIF
ncbi:MAG TPA: hypothetical protein PKC21_08325 [Oligoflexia bacterium]|nr:hypothetical protein [Oligoflexia bacterium]HMR25345.1 hypothetical protein [Oligoflexia bacterium]